MKNQNLVRSLRVIAIIIICFSPLSNSLFAQIKFEKTYGSASKNEFGRYATVVSNNGGYAITGWVNQTSTNKDIYFLRVDTCGRKKISRTYGGSKDDDGMVINELIGGAFGIVGDTKSYGSGMSDAYMMKISGASFGTAIGRAIGDTLDDFGKDFLQDANGNYFVTGYTKRLGNNDDDMFLIKLNSTAVVQWSYKIGGSHDDQSYELQAVSTGGFTLAGGTASYGKGSVDVYLVKTNSGGVVSWAKAYGTARYEIANGMKQTLDGGFILVGKAINSNSSHNSGDDVLLLKVSSTGTQQWVKTYGGLQDETGEDVVQLSDSGYVVVGYTKSFGAGNYDAYLFKVDKNGNTVWARTSGGVNEDKAFSIEKTADGGFILCGHTNSFGPGNFDLYLMKTDANGFTGCNDSSGINTYTPTFSDTSAFVEDTMLKVINGNAVDTFLTIDSVHCSNCNPPLKSLNDIQFFQPWQVFPNPASDVIHVIAPTEGDDPTKLEVYNSVGQLITSKRITNQNSFDIDSKTWVPGIYLLKISSENKYQIQRVIVTK